MKTYKKYLLTAAAVAAVVAQMMAGYASAGVTALTASQPQDLTKDTIVHPSPYSVGAPSLSGRAGGEAPMGRGRYCEFYGCKVTQFSADEQVKPQKRRSPPGRETPSVASIMEICQRASGRPRGKQYGGRPCFL